MSRRLRRLTFVQGLGRRGTGCLHWTRPLRTTGPSRGTLRHFLGAESARVGHFVGNDHTVSRTSNAGRSWRTIRFPG
jgi:hypothetical protein